MQIIISGNIFDGTEMHGPFFDREDAMAWAERNVPSEWLFASLRPAGDGQAIAAAAPAMLAALEDAAEWLENGGQIDGCYFDEASLLSRLQEVLAQARGTPTAEPAHPIADAQAECQNCDWTGPKSALGWIRNLNDRVAPGEHMPAGECPECGALAHLAGEV